MVLSKSRGSAIAPGAAVFLNVLPTGVGCGRSDIGRTSATRNPPRFFRMEREIGTVEAGRLADLVLLDENPLVDISSTRRIAAVVLGGRYLDRHALDRLIADAERAAAR